MAEASRIVAWLQEATPQQAAPERRDLWHEPWAFAVIESVHLLALCALGGSLLLVDLRMLGAGLRRQSVAELARAARPWLVASLIGMVATGVSLFMSEAVKCYHNPAFWIKITTLPIALLYTFAIRERVARRTTTDPGWGARVVAIGSLALWLTVAAAGRWIGFTA